MIVKADAAALTCEDQNMVEGEFVKEYKDSYYVCADMEGEGYDFLAFYPRLEDAIAAAKEMHLSTEVV